MAYRRNGRSRPKTKRDEPSSPHAFVRVLTLAVALMLTAFRLPGMTVWCLGWLAARLTARRPVLSGKGLNGRPAPGDERERRMEASWRRASRWLDGGLSPLYADAMPAMAIACLDYGWISSASGAWRPIMAGVDMLACWLAVMGVGQQRRDMTCTVRGLDSNMRRMRVRWARKRLPWILTGLGAGLVLGVLQSAWTGVWWPIPMLMCLGAAAPMWPAWRANRKRFHTDYESRLMVGRWIAGLNKPPFDALPGGAHDTRVGADGSRVFSLDVSNAVQWANDSTVKTFTPVTQADGMLAGFAYMGRDRTRVTVAVCPVDAPDPADLLADRTMLEARLTVDETRMGAMYGAFPGRVTDVRTVATRDGRPAVRSFRIDGSNADWDMISRDWLKGATPGAFGDWMNTENILVTADPGGGHGWASVDADWDSYEWDVETMRTLMSDTLTRRHDDPGRYMRLIGEDKRLKSIMSGGLEPVKLPVPETIFHDNTETIADPAGWRIMSYAMAIGRAYTAADYMRSNLRGAFSESPIADFLPWLEGDRPRARLLQFVHAPNTDDNRGLPDTLRALTGDSRARSLLARVIVSHACAQVLKTPPTVGAATQLGVGRNTVWRIPIRLEGGLTASDLRRVQERLKSVMGADETLWEWRDQGHAIVWAGGRMSMDARDWRRRSDLDRMIRLRLDEAWAASRAVGADGRPVTTLDVRDGGGRLVRVSFTLPAGLGVEGALTRLDAFRATSGFMYARRVNGDAPLTLLLSRSDPLPERVMADWRLMGAEPDSTGLPFAAGDDGSTVLFDPHDTAHLLITGQTMSGKTSAAVTLVNAALLHGWQAFVGDPVKSGNDFAPVKGKLSGFATGLDECAAMLDWIDREGRRRLALQKEHGVENIDMLPAGVRPPRIIVFLDEFVSLLELSKGMKRNPTGDPDVDNMIMMDAWRDRLKRRIGASVSHILTQHRSQGITMILGSQMMKAESMDALPDAGLAKNQMGRLFVGAGDVRGNVSARNEREGGRLIRQAMDSGGMPKGRGLYERMGRGLQMVQCWWCGPTPDVAARMRGVPDVTPVDWSDLLPARPKQVGVVDQSSDADGDTTVNVAADPDDDDWVLD